MDLDGFDSWDGLVSGEGEGRRLLNSEEEEGGLCWRLSRSLVTLSKWPKVDKEEATSGFIRAA